MRTEQNFNDIKNKLTEDDIDQLIDLLCNRCRANTINRFRANLSMSTSFIPVYGILNRVTKEDGKWSYCAGQSYPDEIRTVRKIILDLK